MADAGQARFAVERVYPLRLAADALEQSDHGRARGKTVLAVS
jgi:NADPH:quinone reductase-like Zn-dependent oxidoreductase